MNAKNLPLKFGLLAVLVVVSIWSLHSRGIQQGIDLRGGHSLIFEIRTNQMELDRQKARLEGLRDDLKQAREAGDTDKVNDLTLAIERAQNDIEDLEKAPPSSGDLSQRMIAILKNRIDPQGLLGVEMTPLGNNRIEIRIPAAREETRQAKNEFYAALEKIERENLRHGQLRRLVQDYQQGASREELAERIADLGRGEPDQVARIEEVLDTYDGIGAARQRQEAAQSRLANANKAWSLLEAVRQAAQRLENTQSNIETARESLQAAEARLNALTDAPGADMDPDHADKVEQAREVVSRAQQDLTNARDAVPEAEQELEVARAGADAGVAYVVAYDRLQDARESGDDDAIDQAQARFREAVRAIEALRQDDMAAAQAALRPLEDLIEGRDAVELAERADAIASRFQEQLNQAKTAVADAREAHTRARTAAVEHGAIQPTELEKDVLALYVSPAEAETSRRAEHKAAVQRKREAFRARVEELIAAHLARKADIEEAVANYKRWADLRRPLDDPEDLKRLVAQAGVLEFRIVPGLERSGLPLRVTNEEFRRYRDMLEVEGPEAVRKRDGEYVWLPIDADEEGGEQVSDRFSGLPYYRREADGRYYLLVGNTDALTMLHEKGPGGWSLTNARPTLDRTNRPAVEFTFDDRGARLFAQMTSAHTGKPMAIMVDDIVYSAPMIRSTISKQGIIEGSFTQKEVEDLARTLQAGSLPARLNPDPVSENTFGPSLGEVNKERGFRAAYWGLLIVAAFMLVYYLMAGFVADVALVLNVILILGAMSLMSVVFTLPGIAGVILTIGIAVDANVLIFERLREEQAKGQSVRMTLANAYSRAFSAIFDANVTTVITCLILGWVGSEEVRGFAITLGLGVVFSMFTALVVTRWVFQFALDRGLMKNQVKMLSFIGTPKINWMGKRHFFWGLSGILVVLGIGSLVWQKGNIWGIEFSSGTQAVVELREGALIEDPDTGERVLPNDAIMREKIVSGAREQGMDKLVETARVVKVVDPDRVSNFLARHDTDPADGKITSDEYAGEGEYFKRLDVDGDGTLTRDELEERLPARAYQITTTHEDASEVLELMAAVIGDAMETLRPHESRAWSEGAVPGFGVTLGPEDGGASVIDEGLIRSADPAVAPELADFQGGAMLVYEDIAPAISAREMDERITDMRHQMNFADHRFVRTKVVPLGDGSDGKHTSLAVLVRSTEPVPRERLNEWVEREQELLGEAFAYSESTELRNFDAAIAGEMAQRAVVAIVLSWLAIVLYLWFRFGSVRWGLAAVVCLIHDVVIVVGMVAVTGWLHNTFIGQALGLESFKIDLAMIAAILTVIGYSVNDTIVVFDRIRENRGKLTTVSAEVINRSVNQTLSRTLLTSGTTFVVVFVMYVFGGSGIHAFSYALLMGVIFGTYSSIAVASPLLMGIRQALATRTVGQPAVATKG